MPIRKNDKKPKQKIVRRTRPVYVRARRANLRRDVHYFKRSFEYTVIDQTTAINGLAFGAWQFNLGNLPAPSEFTNLFDRYMITYVKLYVYLRVTPDAAASNVAHYPMMYVVRDYDDTNSPTAISELFQHAKVQRQIIRPDRPATIKLKPATLGLTYNSAVTSTYVPKWRQWIDMANTTVPHYGLKYGLENWACPGTNIIVRGTMWFRCKDTR